MSYIVAPNQIVWHSKEEKYYYEGEKIDLSHLSGGSIAAVLKSGAVVESIETKEVKHGKTDPDKVNSPG